ncbi:hypothetical protein DFJ73DRAFT_485439 [Zopfochytrium polystomum]|nr:hypothetical protein DFJ73DRAFT_485439 [Zopfochytrium polystomum]
MLNSSSSHYAGSNSLQPNISDSQLAQAARSTSPALDASAKFSTSTWRASPANVGTLRPNQIHQISVSSTLSNSQANAPSPSPRSASLSQHLNWDVARVSSWLSEIGMAKYCDTFSANHISGILLEDLDYDLLRELGVPTVGDQKRILMAIERLSTCPTFSFSFGIPSTPSTASPISRSASNDSGLRPQQMRDLFRTKGLREVALERGSSTSKRASSSLVIAPRSSSMKTGNTLDKSFKLSDYSADVGDLRAGWNSLESSILNMTGEPRIVVRVDGPGGESSNVDVSNLSDGPTIRQKIMKKFDLKGYPERETYILYLLGRDNPMAASSRRQRASEAL